jgi:hypothetical protein
MDTKDHDQAMSTMTNVVVLITGSRSDLEREGDPAQWRKRASTIVV